MISHKYDYDGYYYQSSWSLANGEYMFIMVIINRIMINDFDGYDRLIIHW